MADNENLEQRVNKGYKDPRTSRQPSERLGEPPMRSHYVMVLDVNVACGLHFRLTWWKTNYANSLT